MRMAMHNKNRCHWDTSYSHKLTSQISADADNFHLNWNINQRTLHVGLRTKTLLNFFLLVNYYFN